jgi:hypothetical protein
VNEVGELIGMVNVGGERFNEARYFFLLEMGDGQGGDMHKRRDRMLYITDENMYITPVHIYYERGMLKNNRLTKFNI